MQELMQKEIKQKMLLKVQLEAQDVNKLLKLKISFTKLAVEKEKVSLTLAEKEV